MESENNTNILGLLVADHVSAMLAYWDKNLVCRFANNVYSEWFGKTKEEMINKMTIKELLGPLYEKNAPYINNALKGENQTFEREILLPSGELRYTLANYFPDIKNGEVRGFFVQVTDVTQIKLLEKELVTKNENLNIKSERLLNFANITSHNLRNYAHGFYGLVNILEDADSIESQTEVIGYLKTLSNNFNETVNNLNEIVSVQNRSEIESIAINLYDYVVKTIFTLNHQINNSNAIIKNNIDKNNTILCNPAYIESILDNFISNAIKYKHPDRTPIIELNSNTEIDEVVLTIADNGIGINLEKYGKDLFGMYKTFHGNTDAQGIGLYISKFQIESMGGKVQVESEENIGSKFIIHLKKN